MQLSVAHTRDMESLGAALARVCAGNGGAIIYLSGELGVGKTTLVRGYLRSLGYQGAVKSPTYTLIEPYSVGGQDIIHLDLYRLADPEELEYLGIREVFSEGAVVLVEWPERGAGVLPVPDLTLRIAYAGARRSVAIDAASPRGAHLLKEIQGRFSSK